MAANAGYVILTDEGFQREVLESPQPVLVDFWAAWCGPCRALSPVVEQLAAEFQGRVKVGKLNVDENPQAAMRYGVRSIPTILIFERGQVADQVVGLVPKELLASRLETLLQAA